MELPVMDKDEEEYTKRRINLKAFKAQKTTRCDVRKQERAYRQKSQNSAVVSIIL